MSDNVSGAPRLAWRLSLVAIAAFVLGPIGAHFGLTRPLTGFLIFALGGILGIVCAILGLVAMLRSQGEARATASRGLGIGGIVAVTFFALMARGRSVPRINDISTN